MNKNLFAAINMIDGTSSRGGGGEDESLLSFEELLLGAGEAQRSQRTGLRLGGDKGANINSSSNVHLRSDGLTSEKQDGSHCFLSTLSTSEAGSEAGCDP